MRFKTMTLAAVGAAIALTAPLAGKLQAAEQFIPMLVYRTGPYAPSGTPVANGFRDYYTLLNKRDGGINGVKAVFEECETQYKTNLGVECYEKLKNKGSTGASLFNPYSTGITYQLIPKARSTRRRSIRWATAGPRRAMAASSNGCSPRRPVTGARLPPSSSMWPRRKAD